MRETYAREFISASILACREVYQLLQLPRSSDDYDVKNIGEGGDPSIIIDVKAEAIFFNFFLPKFAVYSEESGSVGQSDYTVVLDPIDGSDNLVSCFPYYGASMALQYQGKTVAAVVCNLANGALFSRVENEPAYQRDLFDNKEMKLLTPNIHAKVGLFEKSSLYTDIIDKLIKNKLKFRSPGAIALSLVYAYSARYMIFRGKERSFDIEAGLFIVESLCVHRDDGVIIVAHEESMLQKLQAIVLGE